MDYRKLEQNLIDVVKEEQAKLGYRKEDIRLYYPLSSLNHFFGTTADEAQMKEMLADFGADTKERLGGVEVSNRGGRFCFHIPKEGAEYVHSHTGENEFIARLVRLVGTHGCTMEQIKQLFLGESSEVRIESVDNGEFDVLISFAGKNADPYYYCFKDEGCHIIYHRFLPEDYEDFHF